MQDHYLLSAYEPQRPAKESTAGQRAQGNKKERMQYLPGALVFL